MAPPPNRQAPPPADLGPVLKGQVVKWADDRGFGFLQPEGGSETVFVHISAFAAGTRRPQEGDTVYFQVDRSGPRTKAANARLNALPLPDTIWLAYGVGALWLAVSVLYALGAIEMWWPLGAYLLVSTVTFGFYYVDKRRAEDRRWRIHGTSLHVLEAIGGWPGALLAMAMLRHLTRKNEHLKMLGAIIAIHLTVWALWGLRLLVG